MILTDNCKHGIRFIDCDECYNEMIPEEDYEDDPYEEALQNCSGFYEKGIFWCGAAGSEECDWTCPFSKGIGKRIAK